MTHSKIDINGNEIITLCVECQSEKLTKHCDGIMLVFENDYRKQTCKVWLGTPRLANWKLLRKFKDEVLSEKECLIWAKQNGYEEKCPLTKERETK